MSTPSLYQIVEKKTWEHSQLRQRVVCFQVKCKAALDLYKVIASASTALEEALLNLNDFAPNAALASNFRPKPASESITKANKHSLSSTELCKSSLTQRIEEQVQENLFLEQGLSYLEKKQRAVKYLSKEIDTISSSIKEALHNFTTFNTDTQESAQTPPLLTAVDIEIAASNGSTLAIEASKVNIQAAKRRPTPDLSQMIRERTHQIIHLQQESVYLERKHYAAEYLHQEVEAILESVQKALSGFYKLNNNAGHIPDHMF